MFGVRSNDTTLGAIWADVALVQGHFSELTAGVEQRTTLSAS